MLIVFSQKIGISNKKFMYIMNSYLIDFHSSKYHVAVFDMHDFQAILPSDSMNIDQFFYSFIDVL